MKNLLTMKIVIIASSVQQCKDQICNVCVYIYRRQFTKGM
jgi:hypothetical protein